MNRVAKIASIGIVGFFSALAALWWFTIGQDRAAGNWVRRVGGTYDSGYPMGYPGVDLSKADPAKIDADSIARLRSFKHLGSIHFARNRNGDILAAEIARWSLATLTQFQLDEVTLTERGYASFAELCEANDERFAVSLTLRRMTVPEGGIRAIAAAKCPVTLGFFRVTFEAGAITALEESDRFTCRWSSSSRPDSFRSGRCTSRPITR